MLAQDLWRWTSLWHNKKQTQRLFKFVLNFQMNCVKYCTNILIRTSPKLTKKEKYSSPKISFHQLSLKNET